MIEVADACFAYSSGEPVLERASLSVAPGERLAILGRNGSGKSTLARLLNGGLVADAGSVTVDGQRVSAASRKDVARRVGFVRQDPRNQLVSALVHDEVAFGPMNLGWTQEAMERHVAEALLACGIEELDQRLTAELSGGQQQLVALAGVLAMEPGYLVLDEVESQLDLRARRRLGSVVDALCEKGLGVVHVTHDEELLRAADRALVLDGGRVAWEGTASALLASDELRALAGLTGRQTPQQPVCAPQAHVLELDSVDVSYDQNEALSGVSLTVSSGVTLLLGASGCGKTTAAKVLAGVLEPDAGCALLDGAPVRPGLVGLAFQRPEDQLFCDTVLDDIAYWPRAQGTDDAAALEAARHAAARLGVADELLERSPFSLSGGQMRRVALAGVVAGDPAAIVFDEPTAGLDGPARRQVRALVAELAEKGCAVCVITHDAGEWLGMANSVAFLAEGHLVAQVPGERAMHSPELFEAAGMDAPEEVCHA